VAVRMKNARFFMRAHGVDVAMFSARDGERHAPRKGAHHVNN
jgi:hypothetical protein